VTISRGAVMGGPEPLHCRGALNEVWRYSKSSEAGPFLNIVFHFPGSLIKPQHVGLRTGRLSSKEQGFMIQVAVPGTIAESVDEQIACEFFLNSIEEALELSRPRWQKHGVFFPYDQAQERIAQARQEILERGSA